MKRMKMRRFKIKLFTIVFVFFAIPLFATDIRQVMFGNNYETIKEISEKK